MINEKKMIVVSACLAGVNCRYDCQAKPNEKVLDLISQGIALPVCPEQLGGLTTPRTPAEQVGDRVMDKNGNDVTDNFHRGALEALKLAQAAGCSEAILKSKSPMCGVNQVYDGTFSGKLTKRDGYFAKLLKTHGFTVKQEE